LGFWPVAEVRDQVSSYEEVTRADMSVLTPHTLVEVTGVGQG